MNKQVSSVNPNAYFDVSNKGVTLERSSNKFDTDESFKKAGPGAVYTSVVNGNVRVLGSKPVAKYKDQMQAALKRAC